MITDKLGIYIHVPFCLSRCYYCDFCTTTGSTPTKRDQYVSALINEIRIFAKGISRKAKVDTVYLGGGTPTLLSTDNLSDILSCVRECFDIMKDAEITIEANPKTADSDKLSKIRGLGFNRLSIGMQSVHDNELRALGRIHKFSDFENFYSEARAAGFENISVDLMYGIPNQTMESFEISVRKLAQMNPEHISSYCLKIEEGTKFHDRWDTLDLPNEDDVSDMYQKMREILQSFGYGRYEISNFASEGRYSRHNFKYWNYDDYAGFGAGAHSFVSGVRYSNTRDVDVYIRNMGKDIREDEDIIAANEAKNEYVMLRMRLEIGVDVLLYNEKFGCDFYKDFGKKFEKFSPEFVNISEKCCNFTEKGMYVSNYILSEVLDFS